MARVVFVSPTEAPFLPQSSQGNTETVHADNSAPLCDLCGSKLFGAPLAVVHHVRELRATRDSCLYSFKMEK